MDGENFDDLVKRITAARLTRLEALRGLIASAAVGLTGATLADATEAKKQAKADGKKGSRKHAHGESKHKGKRTHSEAQPKVTLCHKGQTIEVPQSEAKG